MRTCKKCFLEKPMDAFKKHTHGFRHVCKKCQYDAEMTNPEAHANRLLRMKKYRNSEQGIVTAAKYVCSESGKESRKNAIRRYEQNTGKSAKIARTARRRLTKNQRTPEWLTEDDHWIIDQAYELAALRTKMFGFAWHVDHIIPLQGKIVSGLHVPTNLQVIPWLDNIKKHNRYKVNP
jgi:hypothetical protein